MVKRLFVCNTPYQLIVAFMLFRQLNREGDINDIILTNNFRNSEKVSKRLSEIKFFHRVYYATINSVLFPKEWKSRVRKILLFLFPERGVKKCLGEMLLGDYDEIYYNNDDLFLYNISYLCMKKKKDVKIFRFEEGYSTYITPFCSVRAKKLCDIRNRWYRVGKFSDGFSGSYFYEPSLVLYSSSTPFFTLNRDRSEEFKQMVSQLFEIPAQYRGIKEEWIVFEESFYEDTGFSADLDLYKRINDILKEDMIVKMHPRSKKDRFTPEMIKTLQNDGIPWEAVLLSGAVGSKKFISLASGSIINSQLLLGKLGESWLLYRCTSQQIPNLNTEFEYFLKKLIDKGILTNLHVPDSFEDLERKLEERVI